MQLIELGMKRSDCFIGNYCAKLHTDYLEDPKNLLDLTTIVQKIATKANAVVSFKASLLTLKPDAVANSSTVAMVATEDVLYSTSVFVFCCLICLR